MSRNAEARQRRVILGGAAAAFVAAAAMATGSAFTAAPAKADIDALLDPIIQPLMTSLSDAIAGFDPAAAVDLTSWTDSLLASLSSLDAAAALPAAAEPAAAVPAASGPYDIPLSVAEDTEPTVQATIEGASNTLLVDTGSSGLVLPWEDLGSNPVSAFFNLLQLGTPTGISESGYSGGVDYLYLTYNDATVDYGNGALDTTNTPIDVEFLSWPSALGSPSSFEQFLADDQVTGILGIGLHTGGPTTSPFENYGGVLVDIPDGKLIVDSANPGTALLTVPGNPIADLYEAVNGGTRVAVSDDLDSGGVFGTIPSSLASGSSVPTGTTIDVYTSASGGSLLYSYITGPLGSSGYDGPTPVSGNEIDSGVLPFLHQPIYFSYTNDNMSFDMPGSVH
ncbi:MAG: PecA family PE domain-processing aspartic protease [Mycobacterium sp.]|uniref:PecA family PE domain-processing aspartic protease n=1 Tax=Mycobacterium sp. TaxID=1785 RepID=UPI003C321C0C